MCKALIFGPTSVPWAAAFCWWAPASSSWPVPVHPHQYAAHASPEGEWRQSERRIIRRRKRDDEVFIATAWSGLFVWNDMPHGCEEDSSETWVALWSMKLLWIKHLESQYYTSSPSPAAESEQLTSFQLWPSACCTRPSVSWYRGIKIHRNMWDHQDKGLVTLQREHKHQPLSCTTSWQHADLHGQ